MSSRMKECRAAKAIVLATNRKTRIATVETMLALLACATLLAACGAQINTTQGDGIANVTVAPGIFDRQTEEGSISPDWDGWEGPSPFFLIITDQTDKAAEALHIAMERCMHIDSNGNELTDSALETTDEYTPNYSSPVYLTSHGPLAYLDTKGELPRAMGETMLRVVVDELEAQGVTALVTTPPLGADLIDGTPEWEPAR